MKWLVYLLLLANAAFFARQYQLMSEAPPPRQQAVRPYDHVNRLLLLTETETEKLRVRSSLSISSLAAAVEEPSEPVVLEQSSTIASARNCYSVGPLIGDSEIDDMRAWLVAMGGKPILRMDERRELERYWVYLPPLPSREEAVQKVERMRSEGIEDVIAVPKGDMANAISLGVFSQRTSLQRRLRELRNLGYDPSIMPRYRSEEASWFDVSFDQGGRLSADELSSRFPGAELSGVSCAGGEIAGTGAHP